MEERLHPWILESLETLRRIDGDELSLVYHGDAVRDAAGTRHIMRNYHRSNLQGLLCMDNKFVDLPGHDGIES